MNTLNQQRVAFVTLFFSAFVFVGAENTGIDNISNKKVPGQACTNIQRECQPMKSLVCLEGQCTCPVLTHEELMVMLAEFGIGEADIALPTTVYLDTLWNGDTESCIAQRNSSCIARSQIGQIQLPALRCEAGVQCVPDPLIQDIMGTCGAFGMRPIRDTIIVSLVITLGYYCNIRLF